MSTYLFSFPGWLGRASWQAAVLTVIVLAAQWIFQKQLSARWRHALWFLVVARLAVPFPPSSPVSVFNLARAHNVIDRAVPVAVAAPRVPETANDSLPSVLVQTEEKWPIEEVPPAEEDSPAMALPAPLVAPEAKAPAVRASWFRRENAPQMGAMVWLAGVMFFTARFFGQNLLFLRRLGALRLVTDAEALAVLESCQAQMGVRARIRLAETNLVKSPALYGLWRKTLLLPEGMTGEFSAGEWRHIFLHELAHVKRRDMEVLWLAAAGKILHWFNPVLWYGFRRMAADRELACDELALARAGEGESHAYGETILKLLELSAYPAAMPGLMGIMEERGQMRRRISMIAKFKGHSRWSALAGLLVLGVGLVTLTDAQTEKQGMATDTTHLGQTKKSDPADVSTNQNVRMAEAASNGNADGDTNSSDGSPIIQFDTEIHDFGKALVGETVNYSFLVTNTGDATLDISNVVAGCSCTVIGGSWSPRLAPHESGVIPVSVHTSSPAPLIDKVVTVFSNDRMRPTVVLHMRGVVWVPVEVRPPRAFFTVKANTLSVPPQMLKIFNRTDKPLVLQPPQSSSPAFSAVLITNVPGQEFELKITLNQTKPNADARVPSFLRGTITIPTSSTDMPVLSIVADADVRPEVSFQPGPLPYVMTNSAYPPDAAESAGLVSLFKALTSAPPTNFVMRFTEEDVNRWGDGTNVYYSQIIFSPSNYLAVTSFRRWKWDSRTVCTKWSRRNCAPKRTDHSPAG